MMTLPMFFLSAFLAFVCAIPDIPEDQDIQLDAIEIERIPAIPEFNHLRFMHSDEKFTTVDLVRKHGYNGELHTVVTDDGYILELHRITGRNISNEVERNAKKPVAFVMHGLLCSSASWVLSGPEKGLGFILADAGYDVWLGNARGNMYSRKHTSSSIVEKDYWNFSWHEIGTHDLPAIIDYILRIADQKKLFYLGHSQGTTAFFVMASELPKYQNKIQAMFAMAPVAYCGRMVSPVMQFLARLTPSINMLFKMLGVYEFEPTSKSMRKFQELVCAEDAITQPLCTNVLFLLAGYNRDQFNTTLLPIILEHTPAGASTKQFVHYAQLINSGYLVSAGRFSKYDYKFKNRQKYGTLTPPTYNLGKIKVPVSLHYSTNDWLASVKDVDKLYKELGNPVGKFRVPHKKFNHLDFLWAIDVKTLLYEKILSLMTHFSMD